VKPRAGDAIEGNHECWINFTSSFQLKIGLAVDKIVCMCCAFSNIGARLVVLLISKICDTSNTKAVSKSSDQTAN